MTKEADFNQIAYELAINRPPFLSETLTVASEVLKRLGLPKAAGIHLLPQSRIIDEDISTQLKTSGLAIDLLSRRISPTAVLDLSPVNAISNETPQGPQFLFSVEHFGIPFVKSLNSNPEASSVGSLLLFYALTYLSYDKAPREIELPKDPLLEKDFIEEIETFLTEISTKYNQPERIKAYATELKSTLALADNTTLVGKGAEIQFRMGAKIYLFKNRTEHTLILKKLAQNAAKEFEKTMKKKNRLFLRSNEWSSSWQEFFTNQMDQIKDLEIDQKIINLNPNALNQNFLNSTLARAAYERLLKEYSIETLATKLKEALTTGGRLSHEEADNNFAYQETTQAEPEPAEDVPIEEDYEEFMQEVRTTRTRRFNPRIRE